MRFMLIVKATRHSEAGVRPSSELVEAMEAYCEQLAEAGVLLAAEGLHPSAMGVRLTYPVAGGRPNAIAGPFDEREGIVAGILMIEVESKEQACEWAMQMPDPHGYGEGEVELRPVFDAADMQRLRHSIVPIRRSL